MKSYDLVWLEHLVGDIHQPLHGAVRYFAGKGDAGGNSVNITLPAAMKKTFEGTQSKSAPTELHAFWDDLPGEGRREPLPDAVKFASALPAAPNSAGSDTNPARLGAESLALAKKDSYATPIGKGPSPTTGSAYTMTQDYYNAALADAKDRIALAGARLTKLLNDNLR